MDRVWEQDSKNVLLIHKLGRAFSQKAVNCDIIAKYANGSDCDIVPKSSHYMASHDTESLVMTQSVEQLPHF